MYCVIEIQILDNGNPNILHFEYTEKLKAYEKYHYILAEAAVSTCLTHTAVIMTENGQIITRETFQHLPEPEPTPEPEEVTDETESEGSGE